MQAEKESKEMDTHRQIVEVAERLFRQIGFQKTTVADIARELHMSPANVYRFFAAKSEINAAVCMDIHGKIEAEAEKIAASRVLLRRWPHVAFRVPVNPEIGTAVFFGDSRGLGVILRHCVEDARRSNRADERSGTPRVVHVEIGTG